MAFKRFVKYLLRRTNPAMYVAGWTVVNCAESEPNPEQRLRWDPPDFTKLTYDYMIKQSALEAVNSVSRSLTIAYIAVERTSEDYRRSLSRLMSLMKETLSYNVSGEHWDQIVEARSEMQSKKQIVSQLVAYMEYVNKMAMATSEASYIAGLDNLSTTLARRMDDAMNNTDREVAHNMKLEKEYIYLQEQCARQKTANNDSEAKNDAALEPETILAD